MTMKVSANKNAILVFAIQIPNILRIWDDEHLTSEISTKFHTGAVLCWSVCIFASQINRQ